jgi:hypothetical protein
MKSKALIEKQTKKKINKLKTNRVNNYKARPWSTENKIELYKEEYNK